MKSSSAEKAPRLTFSKQPNDSCRIGQAPRGYLICLGGERIGTVAAAIEFPSRELIGWYFSVRVNEVLHNTAVESRYWLTKESARDAAKAWVKKQLEGK